MKLLRLHNNSTSEVIAKLDIRKNNKKPYYKVTHGSFEPGYHGYILPIEDRVFNLKENNPPEQILMGNYYILKPILKDKIQSKDINQQPRYKLTKDDLIDHQQDILLFWEIPNNYFTNVKYKISGNCVEIASGKVGKVRNNKRYISPAPILEIMGDCKLVWTAKDIQGKSIKQTVEYDHSKNLFNTSPITEMLSTELN